MGYFQNVSEFGYIVSGGKLLSHEARVHEQQMGSA